MSSHRVERPGKAQALSPAKVLRYLLLPLLLLVAQHGALLHELSHFVGADPAGQSGKQSAPGHLCETCLSFAQIQSTAVADLPVLALLTGLSFAPGVLSVPRSLAAELPSRRNRGPPPRR